MGTPREAKDSPKYQGTDETTPYDFDFSSAGTPTDPVVTIYDINLGVDVSSAKLSGTPSITEDVVRSPSVSGLIADHTYRLKCRATVGPRIVSYFLRIIAED